MGAWKWGREWMRDRERRRGWRSGGMVWSSPLFILMVSRWWLREVANLLGLSHQATRIWAKLICCSLKIWLYIALCTLRLKLHNLTYSFWMGCVVMHIINEFHIYLSIHLKQKQILTYGFRLHRSWRICCKRKCANFNSSLYDKEKGKKGKFDLALDTKQHACMF